MKKYFLIPLFAFILQSCTPKPEAIRYGEDQCHYCKMSLVDEKFACEVVTSKGKIYKYDDVSCMVKHIHELEHEGTTTAYTLVNNFDNPTEFLNVDEAVFVTAENFSSPMGGNTAAFKTATGQSAVSDWTQVKNKFNK